MPSTTQPLDLVDLTDTIAAKLPDVPRSVIETEVAEAAHSFADATVHDYLGVLIERAVKHGVLITGRPHAEQL